MEAIDSGMDIHWHPSLTPYSQVFSVLDLPYHPGSGLISPTHYNGGLSKESYVGISAP